MNILTDTKLQKGLTVAKKYENLLVGVFPITKESKYFLSSLYDSSLYDKDETLNVLSKNTHAHKPFKSFPLYTTMPDLGNKTYIVLLSPDLGHVSNITFKYTSDEIFVFGDVDIFNGQISFFEEFLLNLSQPQPDKLPVLVRAVSPVLICQSSTDVGEFVNLPLSLIAFVVTTGPR